MRAACRFAGGILTCASDCTLDTGGCSDCGNGVLDGSEVCDGLDLDDETCTSLGEGEGVLACGADCQFDTSSCFEDPCGNHICEELDGETIANCPADRGWTAITGGDHHTCGLLGDRTVWCWGDNLTGRLGDGTNTPSLVPSLVPVPVTGLTDAVSVSAGESHSCALRLDGTVWCWGAGDRGQLGPGAMSGSNVPVHIAGIADATAVGAGRFSSCALLVSGGVLCWGAGDMGQLGDGDIVDSPTPVPVSNLGTVSRLGIGREHACVIETTDLAWCWGRNDRGQLGIGAAGDHDVPMDVGVITNVVEVSAAYGKHTCALDNTSVAWCWGENDEGQLGDNSLVDKDAPVPVLWP